MAARGYLGIITKDPASDYGIEFPDVPGCFSAGSTMDEVFAMGREALIAHLALLGRSGDDVPPPRLLVDVMTQRSDVLAHHDTVAFGFFALD